MAFKYRADQVGSLLRPNELLEANRNGVHADQLRELEDQQILRILVLRRFGEVEAPGEHRLTFHRF